LKGHQLILFSFFLLFALSFPITSYAIGPPARIYGTISVNGSMLTQDTDTGYSIVVTRSDGSHYQPVILDNDGLTETYYVIDLTLDSPDGPNTNDTALLRVYRKGTALTVISPANGEFTVGSMGSLTQIDIKANATLRGYRQTFMGGVSTDNPQQIRIGGGESLSRDVKIRY